MRRIETFVEHLPVEQAALKEHRHHVPGPGGGVTRARLENDVTQAGRSLDRLGPGLFDIDPVVPRQFLALRPEGQAGAQQGQQQKQSTARMRRVLRSAGESKVPSGMRRRSCAPGPKKGETRTGFRLKIQPDGRSVTAFAATAAAAEPATATAVAAVAAAAERMRSALFLRPGLVDREVTPADVLAIDAVMAALASASEPMVTNAKPRERPLNLSIAMNTSATLPCCEKRSRSSPSVVLKARLPTYNLEPILIIPRSTGSSRTVPDHRVSNHHRVHARLTIHHIS